MDVGAYLRRIGLKEPVAIDRAGLEALQRAHLTAVPFENLDVFHRRGVETGTDWSVPKVVERGRGGWCYELNGAFAALLESLGFAITRLGALVLLDPASAEVDHLTLRVDLERPYLVDVGFGDSFIRPLPLDAPGPHDGGSGEFGFRFDGEATTLVDFRDGDPPQPQYRFRPGPWQMDQFDAVSHRLQTEPGLGWTARPFATRLIDGGPERVTLLADRIKIGVRGAWSEHPVTDAEWALTLDEWFGMSP